MENLNLFVNCQVSALRLNEVIVKASQLTPSRSLFAKQHSHTLSLGLTLNLLLAQTLPLAFCSQALASEQQQQPSVTVEEGANKKLSTGIEITEFAKSSIKMDGKAIGSSQLKCIEFAPTQDPFQEAVANAAISAMERDSKLVEVDATLAKMRRKGQKANEVGRNFAHYLLNYRGVGPSSDGANALMERNIKSSNTLTTELIWEKAVDEKYVDTVTTCAELADALDRENTEEQEKALKIVTTKLNNLLGEEASGKLIAKFKALKNVLPLATSGGAGNIGVGVERERIAALTESVMKNDEIVAEVAQKLSKFTVTDRTQAITGAAQSVLGVAGLAPSLIGPAAQVLKTILILSTGGSEENKLFKEVFLFKRLEVRTRAIGSLASSAVRSHNMANLAKRPFLKAYSEAMMRQLADEQTVEGLLAGKYDDGKALEEKAQADALSLAGKLEESQKQSKRSDKTSKKLAAKLPKIEEKKQDSTPSPVLETELAPSDSSKDKEALKESLEVKTSQGS
jgi:hypothetical protein